MICSYNKSQQDVLFLNFILVNNSTCFGQTYCPSSGVLILYSQQLVLIYLLNAIGLTPGESSTVHIYTQTIHRTIKLTTLVGRLSGIAVNTVLRLLMMDSKSFRNM